MKSKFNFLRKRVQPDSAIEIWPDPILSDVKKREDAESSRESFIDYVRNIIKQYENNQASEAFDRAKDVVDEQR